MFDQYEEERVEGAKTLGEAYEHCKRDQPAFVAGVQFAYDRLLREYNFTRLGEGDGYMSSSLAELIAVGNLRRAKDGEPQ